MEINTIKTELKPNAIERLGNEYYYYNYNIIEYNTTKLNEETQEEEQVIMYEYMQIRLHGTPNYNDCAKSVIRSYISENDEFALINDYNAVQLGIKEDNGIVDEYKNYLNTVISIKEKVHKDFE